MLTKSMFQWDTHEGGQSTDRESTQLQKRSRDRGGIIPSKGLIGFTMRHPSLHRHTLAEMEQTHPSQALRKVRNTDGFYIPLAMFGCYFCVIRDTLNQRCSDQNNLKLYLTIQVEEPNTRMHRYKATFGILVQPRIGYQSKCHVIRLMGRGGKIFISKNIGALVSLTWMLTPYNSERTTTIKETPLPIDPQH